VVKDIKIGSVDAISTQEEIFSQLHLVMELLRFGTLSTLAALILGPNMANPFGK
jgi:hypothetical protein